MRLKQLGRTSTLIATKRLKMPKALDEKAVVIVNTLTIMGDDPLSCYDVIKEISKRDDRVKFVPALVFALRDGKHPMVREIAARTLGVIGSETSIKEAIHTLRQARYHDEDLSVRRTAQIALNKLNEKKSSKQNNLRD